MSIKFRSPNYHKVIFSCILNGGHFNGFLNNLIYLQTKHLNFQREVEGYSWNQNSMFLKFDVLGFQNFPCKKKKMNSIVLKSL